MRYMIEIKAKYPNGMLEWLKLNFWSLSAAQSMCLLHYARPAVKRIIIYKLGLSGYRELTKFDKEATNGASRSGHREGQKTSL